jgi:hypothetical protein
MTDQSVDINPDKNPNDYIEPIPSISTFWIIFTAVAIVALILFIIKYFSK